MSFIYQNKYLTEELIKVGISSLEKYGANVDPDTYDLANKLVIDLQREIDPDNAPKMEAPIRTPGGQPIDLKAGELRNLGDFINWAAENRLEWNGKRFAWKATDRQEKDPITGVIKDNPNAVPNEAVEFSAYAYDRQRDGSRKPNQSAAYALKPELLAFVTYLRDSKENRENRVMQVMIGSLINQINSNLEPGETKLEKRPPKKTTTTTGIDPNIIVDGLPDILDAKNPLENISNWTNKFSGIRLQLPLRILNNNADFHRWIINLVVKDDKGNQAAVLTADKGDPCLAIHILYQRALYLSNRVGPAHDADVPGYSQAAKMYLNKVMEIGKTFIGKDGKPCSIIGPETTEGTDGTGATGTTGGTDPGTEAYVAEVIDQIMDRNVLPLSAQNIDFTRIKIFCGKLKSILGKGNQDAIERNAIISSLIDEITATIQFANSQLQNSPNVFTISGGAEEITPLMAPNKNPLHFVLALQKIVKLVQNVLLKFQSANRSRFVGKYEKYNSLLQEQIEPIFNLNWSRLNMWSNTIKNATIVHH